jgi:hypothetical protein
MHRIYRIYRMDEMGTAEARGETNNKEAKTRTKGKEAHEGMQPSERGTIWYILVHFGTFFVKENSGAAGNEVAGRPATKQQHVLS